MKQKDSFFWNSIGGFIILVLLEGAKTLSDTSIALLLYPYVWVIEVFCNMQLIYTEGVGYIGGLETFVISRECIGNYFVVMLFIISYFGFVGKFKNRAKLKWLLVSMGISIGLGYTINGLRILVSIPYIGYRYFGLVHAIVGISLYLLTLIVVYNGIKYKTGERYEEEC